MPASGISSSAKVSEKWPTITNRHALESVTGYDWK